MTGPVTLNITLPKIPDIELVAIEGLEHLARHLGIADVKIGEAKIIVTEAIINAIEHAGGDDPSVNVKFVMSPKDLVVYVEDSGTGFDPETIPEAEIADKLGSSRKRGWGLKLMRSLSDGFQIESGPHGTKITITKLLS